jgi:hypothetical protein
MLTRPSNLAGDLLKFEYWHPLSHLTTDPGVGIFRLLPGLC